MSGTIFLAGILQFQSPELFADALEALRTEEDYAPERSLIPIYEAAMVNETLMILRHTSHLSVSYYDQVMAEAYLLSEFAGRGYIAGVVRDTKPKVQVAMAAMTHPVIDAFKQQPDPDPKTDYLPRLRNARLEY